MCVLYRGKFLLSVIRSRKLSFLEWSGFSRDKIFQPRPHQSIFAPLFSFSSLSCVPLSHKYGIKGHSEQCIFVNDFEEQNRKEIGYSFTSFKMSKILILAENRCYLVEFFLAEPLVLACEVFIVDTEMVLEIVPGPGDDRPPRHHRQLRGPGGWLVLEVGFNKYFRQVLRI